MYRRRIPKIILCIGWTVAGLSLIAAAAPAGWKTVTSPKRSTRTASLSDQGGGGRCQIAVPPAFVVEAEADRTAGQTGHVKTPDGNLSVSVQEYPPGETVARVRDVAMMFNKDAKPKEDSPERVWLTYTRAGWTHWDIIVPGNPVVCSAHFIIKNARLDDAAVSIIATLGPTK
jgi:hypothetical protein